MAFMPRPIGLYIYSHRREAELILSEARAQRVQPATYALHNQSRKLAATRTHRQTIRGLQIMQRHVSCQQLTWTFKSRPTGDLPRRISV